jgi:hypothetical protein
MFSFLFSKFTSRSKREDYTPSSGERVSEEDLHSALEFLISIEPTSGSDEETDRYEQYLRDNSDVIESAYDTIRRYGMQLEDKTLEAMQEVFYSLTNSQTYLSSALRCSVVRATLNSCWDGIGEWRR